MGFFSFSKKVVEVADGRKYQKCRMCTHLRWWTSFGKNFIKGIGHKSASVSQKGPRYFIVAVSGEETSVENSEDMRDITKLYFEYMNCAKENHHVDWDWAFDRGGIACVKNLWPHATNAQLRAEGLPAWHSGK